MSSAAVTEDPRTNSRIVAAYRSRTPGSAALAAEAAVLVPRGLGPHKWDVDGNRYVDFYGGHGALILGHCNPVVEAAVAAALTQGTQYGANHPAQIPMGKAGP